MPAEQMPGRSATSRRWLSTSEASTSSPNADPRRVPAVRWAVRHRSAGDADRRERLVEAIDGAIEPVERHRTGRRLT
jgi:hypothetical protein